MENKFKQGDRVVLVSGGPIMTVSKIEEDYLICSWFPSITADIKTHKFHKDELKIYETPPIITGKNENPNRY